MAVPTCFRDVDSCIGEAGAGAASAQDTSSIQTNLGQGIGSPTGVFAHMGWVGYVNLRIENLTASSGIILRTTSADINLSQDITTPDVVDGRIDRTVYQLGPKLVGGTLSLPVIADVDPNDQDLGCVIPQDLTGSAATLIDTLWCWTTARSGHGRLVWNNAEIDIRYANHAAFTFTKAVVNSLSMSVSQSDIVSFDVDVIGASRDRATNPGGGGADQGTNLISDFLSPARILTWNDVTVNGVASCDITDQADARLFESAQVREFSFEINNNAERYYSLNGRLFPIDINVSKREITGSVTLLGLQENMRLRAEDQQSQFTRKDEIRMQFFIGDDTQNISRDWWAISNTPQDQQSGANPFFWKKFVGVVFQIEEMSLSNDVFETNINWLALGSDQHGYLAISPGSSCDFPNWQ